MSGEPITIDCHYIHPLTAAAYLIIEGDRALFVENNTSHAVPHLLRALEQAGLRPEQVQYAVITHVHLDHAGGSSALLEACPNATLLSHPRAARHVIDPSRLVASSIQVYGEENFRRLYGEIKPIDEARVRTMNDGEKIDFGSRTLEFLHTRGHANHHFCIYDSGSNGVFTGDSFGIAYPALQENGPFVFASTTPTDFDPVEARASVDRILATGADRAYPTHFDVFTELEAGARQLKQDLDFTETLRDRLMDDLRAGGDDARTDARARAELSAYYGERLAAAGLAADKIEQLRMDIEINAQGIVFAARRLVRKQNENAPPRS